MKAKDYLRQIQKIDRIIKNKLKEQQRWRDMATSTSGCGFGERVQSSGTHQRMADAVDRVVDLEAEINADIDRLVNTKREVISTIEQLEVTEYDILHRVYVQDMDFNAVAKDLDKSYSWVTTVHGRALKNLQCLIDKEEMKNAIH